MKNYIFTSYNCLIKFENKEEFLSINEHLSFENENGIIYVYPTGKTDKYSFSIDLQNLSSSIFYKYTQKDDSIFIFLIDGLIIENIDIYSFSHNNHDSEIEIGNTFITFKTKSHRKTISLPCQIKNLNCGNFKHIDYVNYRKDDKEYLVAFNVISNKAKLIQGENIQIEESGFVVTNKSNHFYKEIVEEYLIDEDGLKIKSRVFTPKEKTPQNMVIYKFMTAINLKDYQTAHSMLSHSLKEKLTPTNLKEYFGEIVYFQCLNANTVFAISSGKNVLFDFTIENGFVSEINDNI